MKPKTIDNIYYLGKFLTKRTKPKKSIEVIGIDTEAYKSGKCFMICTSLGDIFKPSEFPECLFTRRYRGKNFVAYNLKYDSGALVQELCFHKIRELQQDDTTTNNGFVYRVIGNKCFSIRRGKNTIHIYDMYNFYHSSLAYNSDLYLGKKKLDINVREFTYQYVRANWDKIAKYCIQDSILVKELAALIIHKFEDFGVYPKKLYSVAYVSYQYFSTHCKYITVKRYWNDYKYILNLALESYQGGKFEVTRKCSGYMYEYDIISAYPYEIANLVNIDKARIVTGTKYRKGAVYGFLRCEIKIQMNAYTPIVRQRNAVNCYPCGSIERIITKTEYEYLLEIGCDVKIIFAVWLHVDNKTYPYKKEIDKLVKLKQLYKKEGKALDLHTIKIFLNSLYGKFVQLVPYGQKWKASTCWNPIYATIITANVRTRISRMQQQHKSIVAVHTDSLISLKKLDYKTKGELGDMVFEVEGKGCVIGSGVYQIGDKSKIRGYHIKAPLMDLINIPKRKVKITYKHAFTWRETAFRGWSKEMINRFNDEVRMLDVNFDQKRLWLDDYKTFDEVFKRDVLSIPLISNHLW